MFSFFLLLSLSLFRGGRGERRGCSDGLGDPRLLNCSSKPASHTHPTPSSGHTTTPLSVCVCAVSLLPRPSRAQASCALLLPQWRLSGPLLGPAGTPPCGSPSSSAISKPSNRRREAQRCPFSNLLIRSPFVIFGIGALGSRAWRLLRSHLPTLPGEGAEPQNPQQAPEGALWGTLGGTRGRCLSIRSQDPEGRGHTGEGCLPSHFTSTGLWGRASFSSPFPDLPPGHPYHLCPH